MAEFTLDRETMLDLIRNESNDTLEKVDEEFYNETRWGNLYRYVYKARNEARWFATFVETPGTSDMDWVDFITDDHKFIEVHKVPTTSYVWEEV